LAENNPPQRDVEEGDRAQHAAEDHGYWLEMLGPPPIQPSRVRGGETYS
jgi:hypothetical protein